MQIPADKYKAVAIEKDFPPSELLKTVKIGLREYKELSFDFLMQWRNGKP